MKTSRHGFTRCPACRSHVRVGEEPRAKECVFCGGSLGAARTQTVAAAGRGGVLAAALMAVSACGANAGTGASAGDPFESAEETTEPERTNGADEVGDGVDETENGAEEPSDPPPIAAYGIAPPEQPLPPPEVDDVRLQPLYGVPE